MDAPYDLEELPPKRDCVAPQDLVDFIERDCDRIMDRVAGRGEVSLESGRYESPIIGLVQPVESFKNNYKDVLYKIHDRFYGIKIKSIKFESCMDACCGIRGGTGFFVIEY